MSKGVVSIESLEELEELAGWEWKIDNNSAEEKVDVRKV